MDREPDDLEVSILALFGREPLNRHGARRIQDILSQIPVGSVSYDQLAAILSDMIHAGWLVGRILPGPGGVAADIVEIDITRQGTKLVAGNEEASLSRQVVLPTASAQDTSAIEPQPPKCFISYSWDSECHRAWVRKLAEGLRAYHVDAILDQWGVQPGTDLAHFMESAGRTDFVIVVCTPNYARKANEGEASVGYEKRIITAKLRKLHPEDRAIIPVLRTGGTNAIPTFLVDLAYLDFTIDDDFDVRLKDLVRAIFEEPEYVPPPLGSKPDLHPQAPLYMLPTYEGGQLNPEPSSPLPQNSGTHFEPLTADQITSVIRDSVGDPSRESRLVDIMQDESQHVAESISRSVSSPMGLTKEGIQTTVEKTVSDTQVMVSAAAYFSYYGSATQAHWTLNAFGRIAQRGLDVLGKDPSHGLVLLPAALVAFGSLVGALLADKAETAAKILLSSIVRCDEGPIHWPTRINELTVFGELLNRMLLPMGKTGQIGAGTIICDALENMPSIGKLAISHDSLVAAYETAEYAVGLVAQAHIEQEMVKWYVPAGSILWRWSFRRGGGSQRSIEPLETDFRNSGLKNALLVKGFVDGDASAYAAIETRYRDRLVGYGHAE